MADATRITLIKKTYKRPEDVTNINPDDLSLADSYIKGITELQEESKNEKEMKKLQESFEKDIEREPHITVEVKDKESKVEVKLRSVAEFNDFVKKHDINEEQQKYIVIHSQALDGQALSRPSFMKRSFVVLQISNNADNTYDISNKLTTQKITINKDDNTIKHQKQIARQYMPTTDMTIADMNNEEEMRNADKFILSYEADISNLDKKNTFPVIQSDLYIVNQISKADKNKGEMNRKILAPSLDNEVQNNAEAHTQLNKLLNKSFEQEANSLIRRSSENRPHDEVQEKEREKELKTAIIKSYTDLFSLSCRNNNDKKKIKKNSQVKAATMLREIKEASMSQYTEDLLARYHITSTDSKIILDDNDDMVYLTKEKASTNKHNDQSSMPPEEKDKKEMTYIERFLNWIKEFLALFSNKKNNKVYNHNQKHIENNKEENTQQKQQDTNINKNKQININDAHINSLYTVKNRQEIKSPGKNQKQISIGKL